MRTAFLPYVETLDPTSGDHVLVGRVGDGAEYGVGSAPTREGAASRLRAWVLDSLMAAAGDGQDGTDALLTYQPQGPALEFSATDLVPIRIRLLRARQKLSQAQVAVRLGMSQQGYAKLERPGANLQLRTVLMVEAALDDELLYSHPHDTRDAVEVGVGGEQRRTAAPGNSGIG
jgi:DNA-binding XRE family transcriptional regulator